MLIANLGILAGVCSSQYWLQKRRPTPVETAADPDLLASRAAARQAKLSAGSMALATGGHFIYPPLAFLSAGLISHTLYPVLRQAASTWGRNKKITNNSYASLTALLLLASGNYFAAGMQNMVYHLSSHFVSKSRKNATQWITQAYQTPSQVRRLPLDGTEQSIALEHIQAGDAILVQTGETIPMDGTVQSGMALVDQQALTGEANPLEKTTGDSVLAATLLLRGRLVIIAQYNGSDNRINQLNALLQQTRDYKTTLQLQGEVWADKFALPIIAASALMIPILGVSPALALLFSAPLNVIRAMLSVQTATHLQWIAEQGAFIKDGRVLEALPKIDIILFDKTGTLTETTPEVAAIICCTEIEPNHLLALAAAAEQRLEHPIAQAILAQAEQLNLTLPEVTDSQYDLGLGVTVQIAQQTVQVGSLRFILQTTQSTEADLPTAITQAMQAAAGHTFILIAINGVLHGMLELRPRLRPEATALLQRLQQRGFAQLGLVSGDQQQPTQRLADHLGLDTAYGEVLPQDKAGFVKRLQDAGHQVCFVGDGLNDAIAMKQANVSICLNSASAIAREAAQIVLVNDTLTPIDQLFDLSTHLHQKLGTSLRLWIGFGVANALAVPLLAFGPLQSSLLYMTAYGAGLKFSRRCPGKTTQPQLPCAS